MSIHSPPHHFSLFLAGLLLTVCGPLFAGQWSYHAATDPMTSKRTVEASITGDNTLSFESPYSGRNMPHLSVRLAPRSGLDVYVELDKGQFVCSVSECRVLVRFDEQPPMYFSAIGPADHSSTILFLRPTSKFVDQARKAKRIRVQANIYREGAPIMEFFTLSPLVWPWPPKQAAASAPQSAPK